MINNVHVKIGLAPHFNSNQSWQSQRVMYVTTAAAAQAKQGQPATAAAIDVASWTW
jgi:hypothetical protein